MYHIGLMFDYHKRSRALHQLIAHVERTRYERRQEFFSKSNRENTHADHFRHEFFERDDADEQLLLCLNQLWEVPGMSRQRNPRPLRSKQFIKYAQRLLSLIDHQYAQALRMSDTKSAAAFWLTSVFLLDEIDERRWEQGMSHDANSAPPSLVDSTDVGLDIVLATSEA